MKLFTKAFAAFGAVAVMIGCGGGGGGATTGSGSAGNARVGIFVTDDLSTNYDHVWVTIKKVEISGPSNKATAYQSATGQVVDLRALNQAGNQIFSMLGEATVPAGTYNKAEITLDDDVVLFPTGATTGLDRKFAGSVGGLKQLEFNLTQQTISGASDIVADFDLSKWTDDGAQVHAVVVEGNDDSINEHQEDHDFAGAVVGLSGSAPNLTFELSVGFFSMHVRTTEATNIFNSNGAANPTLENGTRVEVTGTFDTNTRTLIATDIKINSGEDNGEAEVKGLVGSIGADTFDLSTARVEGFVPTSTSIHVALAADARFFTDGGLTITKDEFFAALTSGSEAEAEGSYDETSNTLTATKLKLENEDEAEDENEAEVQGAVSDVDSAAGTFKVTVSSWEGVLLESGTVITVVTNGSTEFRGVTMATLAAGSTVEIKGSLQGSTLTAERVKSEDDSGGGGHGGGGDDDGGGDDH